MYFLSLLEKLQQVKTSCTNRWPNDAKAVMPNLCFSLFTHINLKNQTSEFSHNTHILGAHEILAAEAA